MRPFVKALLDRFDAGTTVGASGGGGSRPVPAMQGWEALVIAARSSERDPDLADLDDGQLEDAFRRQASLQAQVMARWLKLLREVLVRGVWAIEGVRLPSEWLSYTVGMSPSTAREHCRMAMRLPYFPATRAKLEAGEISYTKARAITRLHDAGLEGLLLRYAREGTGAQLERIVSGFTASVRKVEADENPVPVWDRARVSEVQVDHEVTELRITLPTPEARRALAVFEARAARVRAGTRAAAKEAGDEGRLASRRLGVDLAEAFVAAADLLAEGEPDDGSGADRLALIIHADAEQLAEPAEGEDPIELVETSAGSRQRRATMSARTLRRLACDARYGVIGHDEEGDIAGVSGTTRRIPSRLRRALLARDRTCRFPSCHRTRGLHGHHIIHVEHGGETVLENLILLCGYHHTFVHESGWTILHDGKGRARFKPPKSAPLPTARPMLRPVADPAESAGRDPAESRVGDRDWRRTDVLRARNPFPCDYDTAVQVMHQELRRLEPPPDAVVDAA